MVRSKLLFVGVISIAALCATTAMAEILIGVAGPMTGKDAWFGAQLERGAALAVADLNAAGGVLGEQVELITADDFCDPEQAVAAAKKLVSDGVIFVVGHYCSGASIPASEVYEAAGVLMISPTSSNPMLTELGRANVFRVMNRDDANGVLIGNYLADHWSDKKIAILHDDTVYGKGAAEEVKKSLNGRGMTGGNLPGLCSRQGQLWSGNRSASGGRYRRGIHWRIPHRDRADGASRTRPRLFGSVDRCQQPGNRGVCPYRRRGDRRNALY